MEKDHHLIPLKDRILSYKHKTAIKKERGLNAKLRGFQPICLSCEQTCKVFNAPNSTFRCFARIPKGDKE